MIRRVVRAVRRRVLGQTVPEPDYRQILFEELRDYLQGASVKRALEIGPKDGLDTRRLLTLGPEQLVLIDLPRLEASNQAWLKQINSSKIQYLSANVMYSDVVEKLEPFDVVWCTGVLYHNPEQLRMVRKLYDILKPGGVLVLESATVRTHRLRNANCVEINYPPSLKFKKKYHISMNITHLPSARAIESWMGMVGFENIVHSVCHRQVSAPLARVNAAYLGTKPLQPKAGTYYSLGGEDGFVIGKSL